MTHKLPELFEHIIEFDKTQPYRYDSVVPITALDEINAWRARRAELSAAVRGRGGTGWRWVNAAVERLCISSG